MGAGIDFSHVQLARAPDFRKAARCQTLSLPTNAQEEAGYFLKICFENSYCSRKRMIFPANHVTHSEMTSANH